MAAACALLRMELACGLLEQLGVTVWQAARQSDYSTEYKFARAHSPRNWACCPANISRALLDVTRGSNGARSARFQAYMNPRLSVVTQRETRSPAFGPFAARWPTTPNVGG
jgi:hypothetical protein